MNMAFVMKLSFIFGWFIIYFDLNKVIGGDPRHSDPNFFCFIDSLSFFLVSV